MSLARGWTVNLYPGLREIYVGIGTRSGPVSNLVEVEVPELPDLA